MATVHRTTLVPAKLELLTDWLPAQGWHVRTGGGRPQLSRAGGFRLDDPGGEVGIEFMIVLDHAAGDAAAYLVPMTYRGSPLAGADDAPSRGRPGQRGLDGCRWQPGPRCSRHGGRCRRPAVGTGRRAARRHRIAVLSYTDVMQSLAHQEMMPR